MVKKSSPATKKVAPADEQEPFHGFLQLYRVKINDIDYILFGPPITLDDETLTLALQDFHVGELLPAEVVLRSIRLAMDPVARGQMVRRMQ